jgi:hypothetical protein
VTLRRRDNFFSTSDGTENPPRTRGARPGDAREFRNDSERAAIEIQSAVIEPTLIYHRYINADVE